MNHASRSTRLLGQFIDGIVGGFPLVVAVPFMRMSAPAGIFLVLAGFLWALFYYLFADGFRDGRSVGKSLLGMQVVDATTGRPCTFGQSFVRNLLLAILGPIDWVFIFGERSQRLGDKAADTIVIVA